MRRTVLALVTSLSCLNAPAQPDASGQADPGPQHDTRLVESAPQDLAGPLAHANALGDAMPLAMAAATAADTATPRTPSASPTEVARVEAPPPEPGLDQDLVVVTEASQATPETSATAQPAASAPPRLAFNPAMTAALTDGLTTLFVVESGIGHETNPLIGNNPASIVAVTLAKIWLGRKMEERPEPQRTSTISALQAIWGGATANNLGVIANLPNPVSLLLGIATGIKLWLDTEPERSRQHQGARPAASLDSNP